MRETAVDGALVVPFVFTTTTEKYQVPATSPLTTPLVDVAPGTDSVEPRLPGEGPYRTR